MPKKLLNVPVLTKSDLKKASPHQDNCAPVSITALTGQPYEVIHEHCETYSWSEADGLDLVDILFVLRDFGYRYKYLKKVSEQGHTLSWVLNNLLDPAKKYLIGTKGHVLAVVYGTVVDIYGCRGNTKVQEIIEVR